MSSGIVCVFCRRRPADQRWRPFCSERCKLLDLGDWLDGRYRIPGESVPLDEGEDDETGERSEDG